MRVPVRVPALASAVAALLWLSLGAPPAHAAGDAAAKLAVVDQVREVARAGLSVRIREEGRDAFAALIRTRGEEQRIDVEAPAARKGEVLLFAGGRLWYHRPGLKRPAVVSPGQVFGGVELLMLLRGLGADYRISTQRADAVDGRKASRLELVSTSSSAPWPRIHVWLVTSPSRVVRMAVLDGRGEPVRTVSVAWENTLAFNGERRPFPSKVSVEERGRSGSAVILHCDVPVPGEQPADLFSPARLGSP